MDGLDNESVDRQGDEQDHDFPVEQVVHEVGECSFLVAFRGELYPETDDHQDQNAANELRNAARSGGMPLKNPLAFQRIDKQCYADDEQQQASSCIRPWDASDR